MDDSWINLFVKNHTFVVGFYEKYDFFAHEHADEHRFSRMKGIFPQVQKEPL